LPGRGTLALLSRLEVKQFSHTEQQSKKFMNLLGFQYSFGHIKSSDIPAFRVVLCPELSSLGIKM
jgi:hypothetical protein